MSKTAFFGGRGPWILACAFTLGLTALWFFVWPEKMAAGKDAFRAFAVRWAHGACWFCLFLSSAARLAGNGPANRSTAGALARLGGVLYAVFAVSAFTP